MDPDRFDTLARGLGVSLTRQGLVRLVLGLGSAGIAAGTGSDRGAAKQPNPHHHHHHHRRHHHPHRRGANTCPPDKKNAVCHCPPGLGGAACKINCVGTGGGHDNDPFDCMCAGHIHGVPDCDPASGRCPEDLGEHDTCGGPTTCTGTCTTAGDCPFGSVPGCTCNTASGQCEGPLVTCGGGCSTQETCTSQGTSCVCLGLTAQSPGSCGDCIDDGQAAGTASECCSRQLCEGDICGQCVPVTCEGTCGSDNACRQRGGATCRCVGGTCQTGLGPMTICPPGYAGNATSPCDPTCPCLGGRRCKQGRCCESKGTHCKSGQECCSGRCKRLHANHKQCG